jgi:hypothetical protein
MHEMKLRNIKYRLVSLFIQTNGTPMNKNIKCEGEKSMHIAFYENGNRKSFTK